MRHRIRYQNSEIDLADGQYMIGRSASCQISLDDPLVSRNHARLLVRDGGIVVEDCGSRNGVLVNGERVAGSRTLTAGDRMRIGSQELLVLGPKEGNTASRMARAAPTHRLDRFAVVGELSEKAFTMGRPEEAAKLLEPLLLDTLRDALSGREVDADRALSFAARLAAATGDGRWFDYAVELYTAVGRPWPAEAVDGFYVLLRKIGPVNLAGLSAYAAALRAGADKLGPRERFVLSRIEGLERLARAR